VDDPIASLREAASKSEAKVARLRNQLTIAEKELEELGTALRVVERFTGYGTAAVAATTPVSDNGAIILKYVEDGEANGKAPKDVFEQVIADGHDLNADLIRTQLWRMAKRGTLATKDGRYWRPVSEAFPETELPSDEPTSEGSFSGPADGSQGRTSHPDPEGSIPSGSTLVSVPFPQEGWDIDDDVPF
jgi:hypothetical protein